MIETVLNQIRSMATGFMESLPRLGLALLVLVGAWIATKVVRKTLGRVLDKMNLRSSLRDLAQQLSVIATWLIGITVSATVAFPSLTPGQLLGVVGLGSVAVGFAFKDIFENFFAGILILWQFPFENDDVIECNGITGRVEDVTVRMTLVRQLDGQLVVVPNSVLFKNAVTVVTAQAYRRITIGCGVAYGEDVGESRSVIEKAVRSCKTVSTDHAVDVFANEFADSSINFDVRWWSKSQPIDHRRSRDEVIEAIKLALDDAGIEIPFPYRTLTFKSEDPLHLASHASRANSKKRESSQRASAN